MAILLMQQSFSEKKIVRIEIPSHKVWTIEAACINCNKRFTSMRAVTMHLKMTATRHVVNFINYGNYDKKTGLREINRPFNL
jgi:hypothetical protein